MLIYLWLTQLLVLFMSHAPYLDRVCRSQVLGPVLRVYVWGALKTIVPKASAVMVRSGGAVSAKGEGESFF